MGKINVLSFSVANLIAAGEVVDRPSSVIKELLENSIDSGATSITVEIQNGGVTYMRVSDNGCGMEPDDLPIAIRRHATSKIRNAEDLESILTLGFRGEALAAIASVSDLRIISRPKGAPVGAMLRASAGNILGVSERASAEGTTVIVENLFSNVPARRKFLKKDVTEAMAVSAIVEKIALSKPDISFRFIVDGNVKLETIGDGNIKNTIYSVFGREFASKLISADLEVDGIRVHGYIGRSDNVRANRNYQNFFINGRYVKSRTAGAALEQAYTSYIAQEKFPCCVLFLEINPAIVDVNVHPAKLEVKFSNEKPVFEAVYYAVRNSLEQNSSRPDADILPKAGRSDWIPNKVSESNVPIDENRGVSLKSRQIGAELYVKTSRENEFPALSACDKTNETKAENNTGFVRMSAEEYVKQYVNVGSDTAPEKAHVVTPISETNDAGIGSEVNVTDTLSDVTVDANTEKLSLTVSDACAETDPGDEIVNNDTDDSVSLDYRMIGEAFRSYVIVEQKEKMLLIDKHAAHERIIFERLKAAMKNSASVSQMLMIPLEIMMTSDEIQTLVQYRQEIESTGFEFTAGRYSVSVSAVPEGISTDAVSDMLVVMAERIKSGTGNAGITRDIVFEKALYQASCKAAIKAGREYADEHIQWIVDKLMALPDITVCPHGRPVAIEITKKKLDRLFERT